MTDTINPIFEHAQNVREKMGYAPLPDPTVIQGDPVPFRTEREEPVTDDDFPDEEVTAPAPPPSPLHRLGRTPSPPVSESDAPVPYLSQFPEPNVVIAQWLNGATLTVRDNAAVYRGRPVELTDKDITSISRVVLVALKRQVQAQLAEVEGLLPKRTRRPRKAPAATNVPTPESQPKRRGRPRKIQP